MYEIDDEYSPIVPRPRSKEEEEAAYIHAASSRNEAQVEIRALNAAGQRFSWGGYAYPFVIPEKDENDHPTYNSARVVTTDVYSQDVVCLEFRMVFRSILNLSEDQSIPEEEMPFLKQIGQFVYRFVDDPLHEAWRPENEFKKRFQERFNRPWKWREDYWRK